MWHRLNSYKTTLQCHDESHSNSSSSHAQLELYRASGKLREKSSVLSNRLKAILESYYMYTSYETCLGQLYLRTSIHSTLTLLFG